MSPVDLSHRHVAGRALVALVVAALAVAAGCRIYAVNSEVTYTSEHLEMESPAESNLDGIYELEGRPRVGVEKAFLLSEDESLGISSDPLLAGFVDGSSEYVILVLSVEGATAPSSQDAAPYLFLQTGIRFWQQNPLVAEALTKRLSPLCADREDLFCLVFNISPGEMEEEGRTAQEAMFSLVTSTWPTRVAVDLGRLPVMTLEEASAR